MFTVIKLGGVNGSGKTSVARKVITLANAEVRLFELRSGAMTKVYNGEYEDVPVIVLGSYENTCGGMDTIGDKEDRLNLVADTAKKWKGLILFEGLITGKTYGALGALSEQHVKRKAGRWLYAFMDTPFEVSTARVLQRRLEAGNTKPFDPERTMRSTYDQCRRLEEYLKGTARGRNEVLQQPVISLKHKHRPATLAKNLLDRAVEIHHAGF